MSLSRIMSFGQGKVTTSRRVLAHQAASYTRVMTPNLGLFGRRSMRSTGGLAENTPLRT